MARFSAFRLFRTFRSVRTLAALITLTALVSCGGGGDDAGAPLTPSPPAGGVTLTGPANLASGLTGTIALSATVASAVTSVEFQVDGVTVGSVGSAPYTLSLDTTAYASGQHVVRSRATNAGGSSAWSSATVSFGGSRTQPAGFTRNETYATGLQTGTALAQAPDGRWFIAVQAGLLRVIKGGSLLTTPALALNVDVDGERGLLGVAVHPNFASNGFVYLYYTTAAGGIHNRISRFTMSGDVISPASELILAELPALGANNHNGGALHFGSDGKLYVGVGDNAVGANSQSLSTVFGKLLRFNDDGTIPTDNPFYATTSGNARAIWALGLRNPFTFAVQPGTGRIHINDVGLSTWEEIDLGTAGANYGWPNSEGGDNLTAAYTAPLFSYGHSPTSPAGSGPGGFFTGVAIAGGAFYPASGPFPAAYRGSYFFADFGTSFIARFDIANNAVYSFGKVSDNPVDMAVGADGALYVLTRDTVVRFSAP